jgi:hypothetical protein
MVGNMWLIHYTFPRVPGQRPTPPLFAMTDELREFDTALKNDYLFALQGICLQKEVL